MNAEVNEKSEWSGQPQTGHDTLTQPQKQSDHTNRSRKEWDGSRKECRDAASQHRPLQPCVCCWLAEQQQLEASPHLNPHPPHLNPHRHPPRQIHPPPPRPSSQQPAGINASLETTCGACRVRLAGMCNRPATPASHSKQSSCCLACMECNLLLLGGQVLQPSIDDGQRNTPSTNVTGR